MSLKVMTKAWGLKLSPTPKLVLMAIADEANDDGYCYPSHRHLAEKCSIDARSVRRMIGVLSASGYVVVKRRYNNRARTSNGYQLMLDHPRTNCPGGTDSDARGDRAALSRGPGHARPGPPDMDVRVPTTDPLVNPKPPPQRTAEAKPDAAGPPIWDVLGGGELCFPESLSSAQRRAIAGHLLGLKTEDAQQVLDELAGQMERGKVHKPVGYCVALVEKLKRGQFAPEAGLPIAERRAAERLQEQVLRAQWTTAQATTTASRKAIPPNALAALDRLRGRVDREPQRPASGSVEGDLSNARDEST
jgi:hypothetical protein